MVPVWDSPHIEALKGSTLTDLLLEAVVNDIGKGPWKGPQKKGLHTLVREGFNPNLTWMPAAVINWPATIAEPKLGDQPHANSVDMAIESGNRIALELLLTKASTILVAQSARDLLERNALNRVYKREGEAWNRLTHNQLFGLFRIILRLHHRSQENPILPKLVACKKVLETDPKTAKLLAEVCTD